MAAKDLFHSAVKSGLQRDGWVVTHDPLVVETETGIANELAAMGVPKEDIVLAFYPPYRRPFTGFGVN